MLKTNKENIAGLASVVAIKAIDAQTRQKNREKHRSIINWVTAVNEARKHEEKWKKPTDWRLVTERSINRYIPAEINTQATTFIYVTQQLARYEKPKTVIDNPDETTPLWYLSRNALRRALYRASARRRTVGLELVADSLTKPPGH